MRAIIVDDSRAMRTILRRALARHGFEVYEAGDGSAALAELGKTGALDLALIDWNMPIMTGYELLCELRSQSVLNKMAIMMVTTETEASQVQRALDAGADEYVKKPFSDEELREKLRLLGFAGEQ